MIRSAILSFAGFVAVAAVPAIASACGGGAACGASCGQATIAATPTEMTVEQVAKALKAKSAVALDANGPKTRAKYGVVPGATLLSHHTNFAAKELPASKDLQLVFYCANDKCSASEGAAKVAVKAGYKNVAVMRAGIMGWKKAGQKTATPSAS